MVLPTALRSFLARGRNMTFKRGPARSGLYLVLLMCFLTPQAWSQTALSEITGDVTDATGTALAHVAVKLKNEATGVETILNTNDVGVFSSRSIQPGTYRIEAGAPGFKTFVATHVELRTGQVLRHNIVLQVGDVTQQVEVQGSSGAVELQKDSGDVSTVLNQQVIREIPSGTRKVLELVELTPGVTLTGRGSAQA